MASCFINPLFILELTETILVIGVVSIAFGIFMKHEHEIGCLDDATTGTGLGIKKIYNRFIIIGIVVLILGLLSYIVFQGGARKCFPIYMFFMELFNFLITSGFIILLFGLYKHYQKDHTCINNDTEKHKKQTNGFLIVGTIFIILGFIAFFVDKFLKVAKKE